MDAHVHPDPAAHGWVAEGGRRRLHVQLEALELERPPQLAGREAGLRADVVGVVTAHEGDLEAHARHVRRCDGRVRLRQGQREGLLAQDVLAGGRDGTHRIQVPRRADRDQHRLDVGVRGERLGGRMHTRVTDLRREATGGVGLHIAERDQPRFRHQPRDDPGMGGPHPAAAEHPQPDARHHRQWACRMRARPWTYSAWAARTSGLSETSATGTSHQLS